MVLGDDIVIFDKDVAREYLAIMKDLGVDINLTKSLVSKDTFEFAKRVIALKGNLSMVSFKELDVSMASLDALSLMISKFSEVTIKPSVILRLRGYGYRVLSTFTAPLERLPLHLRHLVLWLSFPGRSPYAMPDYTSWFALRSFGRSKGEGLNLQSLRDSLALIFKATELLRHSNPGYYTEGLDIWGPTGVIGDHWTSEYLEGALQNVLYPACEEMLESQRQQDQLRASLTDIGTIPSEELTHSFINGWIDQFLELESEMALTPHTLDISEYRDRNTPIPPKAGRYLTWWVKFSQSNIPVAGIPRRRA